MWLISAGESSGCRRLNEVTHVFLRAEQLLKLSKRAGLCYFFGRDAMTGSQVVSATEE